MGRTDRCTRINCKHKKWEHNRPSTGGTDGCSAFGCNCHSFTAEVSFEGHRPRRQHLLGYDGIGLASAYEIGSSVGIVGDPNDPHPQFLRMLLIKAVEGELQFRCVCNPRCHVVRTYKMTEVGSHNS